MQMVSVVEPVRPIVYNNLKTLMLQLVLKSLTIVIHSFSLFTQSVHWG